MQLIYDNFLLLIYSYLYTSLMILEGNGTNIAAAVTTESIKLGRIYKAADELLSKPSAMQDAKEILTETFSRLADQDIVKNKATASQRILDLAKKAFIQKDREAIKAFKQAFITDIALESSNAIEAANNVAIYSQLYDQIIDNIMISLESSNITPQTVPYVLFSAPLLRFMMPRLITSEVFTTVPMKVPNMAIYFLKFYQDNLNNPYPFASYLKLNNNTGQLESDGGIAGYGTNPGGSFKYSDAGNTISPKVPAKADTPVAFKLNVVDTLKYLGLVPSNVTTAPVLTGSVSILTVTVSDGTNSAVINVNGRANEQGTVYGSGVGTVGGNTVTVTVSGRVDYVSGNAQIVVQVSGLANATIEDVQMSGNITYELRNPARTVNAKFERIDIGENRIEETLIASPEFLYDSKMMFDIDLQAEIISVLGTLLAVNTDAFMLAKAYNTMITAGSPSAVVSSVAPPTFAYGTTKWWYEGAFIPAIFKLEAELRKYTPSLDVKPYLIMNPVDASYVRSADKFTAKMENDGGKITLSRRVSGTIDNTVDILVTPLLPQGVNIMLLKSLNPLFATAVYAPYVTMFAPYPANSTGPALTGIHRFGAQILHPQAFGAFIVT